MSNAGGTPLPDMTSTVAIVTTFHPEPGLIDRLAPILGRVGRTLIVDNGSTPPEQAEIRTLVDRGEADATWNATNLGLAAALDQGLGLASEQGASWALLLDQDSRPEPHIVAEAARVLGLAGSRPVAALGAGMVGRDAGKPTASAGWQEERAVITSGTFVSVKAWRAVGGFRRDFFVDYVDLEFCLRARAAGYRILRSLRPTIRHAIGHPERRRLLWRTVTTTRHGAGRRYLITRNRVVVWRTYWRREPRFVAADAWGFAKEVLKIALLEDDRMAKTKAIAAGLRDGLRMPGQPR